MKTLTKYIFLALALMMSLSSCDAWLDDVDQTSTVSDEIVWQDENYVDMYVNGFYTYLHKYGQFGENQFGGSLTESLTDTFKYGSEALGHRAGHPNNYVTNPDVISPDGCLYDIWGTAYENIRRINQFLDMQKQYSKFPEEKNIAWEAQARFFRAFVYFQLAKRHCGPDGGLILYDALPLENKDKSSAEETWDFIEADLTFAAANLPDQWNAANRGRVTKGAANAMLSRVMLYAERWQKAYDAADAVVQSGLYSLVADYAQAWKGNNSESILEFAFNANTGPNHTFDQYYVPMCDGYDFGALGTPTQEMVECYETKDGKKVNWDAWHGSSSTIPPFDQLEPRFAATVIYPGSTWKGRVMDCSVGGINGAFMAYRDNPYSYGKTTTGYFLRKLLDETLIDIKGTRSSQTWVEIRYAEVLLNKAEAAHRLNKVGEAQDLLFEVRNRVGLPKKTSSGNEWFDDYRNERKVELAYEGHLFWDMRRWKLAATEYNNYQCHGFKISGEKYADVPVDETGAFTREPERTYEYVVVDNLVRKFPAKLYTLPIPTSELKNNKNIEQYATWK